MLLFKKSSMSLLIFRLSWFSLRKVYKLLILVKKIFKKDVNFIEFKLKL